MFDVGDKVEVRGEFVGVIKAVGWICFYVQTEKPTGLDRMYCKEGYGLCADKEDMVLITKNYERE